MLNIGFVLYHTGETKALLPAMSSLAMQQDKYKLTIIPAGISAQNIIPKSLKKFCKTPLLIQHYLGLNDDYQMHFSDKFVMDIVKLLEKINIVISGCPSQIQHQVIRALPDTTQKIIIFDMPYPQHLVKKFAEYANAFIFTDSTSLKIAQKKLTGNLQLYCARHGDFDLWLSNHHKNLRDNKKIRKQLKLNNNDKIILWLGGYGALDNEDTEMRGFKKFLAAYKKVKDKFKLRITIHPGLKHFNQQKLIRIINQYYLNELQDIGFNKQQAQETISKLDSNQVASIACGAVSVNSTAAHQSIFIGTPAKYIYLPKQNIRENVEVIKNNKQWLEIFDEWIDNKNRKNKYLDELNKLAVPLDISVEQTIIKILSEI